MAKTVYLFSGQGSQYSGMGSDLCSRYHEALDIYQKAADVLGFDVLKLSSEGDSGTLAKTAVSQPLIFTLSMAAFAVLRANGAGPDAVAGFSLGECSALTAAGAMTLETGLKVIKRRARAMQRAAEASQGCMYAVIGSEAKVIEQACVEADGYVVPVNYNCPGQIVIAGEADAAREAAENLSALGAKIVKLAVNAAFHSNLMRRAADDFYASLGAFSFEKPGIPVYSNVTGEKMEQADQDDIPSYLKRQMVSPVRFIDEMQAMKRDGCTRFIELGPGKTLCSFIRKTLKGVSFAHVEDSKTLLKALEPVE